MGGLNCNGNFYPRSPCGERPDKSHKPAEQKLISIHALLAESDSTLNDIFELFPISIHALLAESDFGRAFWPGLSL